MPPIILLHSSASAMGRTCRAATGSAIPSRPIGRRLPRRRSGATEGRIAGRLARDRIVCRPPDCCWPARRLSWRRCGTAGTRRLGHPRLRRRDTRRVVVCRHPRLHGDRRRMPGPSYCAARRSIRGTGRTVATVRRAGAQVHRRRHARDLSVRQRNPRHNVSPRARCRRRGGVRRRSADAARRETSKPTVAVDFALHLGEVQYGNIGAVDRLDFTVIGRQSTRSRASRLCASRSPAKCWSLPNSPQRSTLTAASFPWVTTRRRDREMQEIYGLDLG